MAVFTVPVMLDLVDNRVDPERGRAIAARIEEVLIGEFGDELVQGDAMVVALEPIEGVHLRSETRSE